MLDFFEYIANFFEVIIHLITNIIESMISFFVVVSQSISLSSTVAFYTFPLLASSVLAVLFIGALKLIIGR